MLKSKHPRNTKWNKTTYRTVQHTPSNPALKSKCTTCKSLNIDFEKIEKPDFVWLPFYSTITISVVPSTFPGFKE